MTRRIADQRYRSPGCDPKARGMTFHNTAAPEYNTFSRCPDCLLFPVVWGEIASDYTLKHLAKSKGVHTEKHMNTTEVGPKEDNEGNPLVAVLVVSVPLIDLRVRLSGVNVTASPRNCQDPGADCVASNWPQIGSARARHSPIQQ